jgi:hypothetical protein
MMGLRLGAPYPVGAGRDASHPTSRAAATRSARRFPAPGRSQAQPEQALLAKGAPPQPSPLLEEGGRAYQPGAPKGASPAPGHGFTARPYLSAFGGADNVNGLWPGEAIGVER